MKFIATASFILLTAAGHASAQMDHMKDMPMNMKKHGQSASMNTETHRTAATVKSVNPAKGTVTLSHEPVKTLNWPAMTMGFAVEDKKLFDKLKAGEKVNVEFMQKGKEYIVTAVN